MNEKNYPLLESVTLPSGIKELGYKELEQLAEETRQFIIETVSKTGGHLAPSLGVVELTIAILRLTNPLEDRIIWDVGHQSYPYKVLTDRLKSFNSLRQFGGLSGFANVTESPYDAFGTGHSSTSISAGLGIACANHIRKKKCKVVSVIGDGALSGGMAFEALNNLGNSHMPMVVVLNDNEMSIGPNVGAVSHSLSRMLTGDIAGSIRSDIRKALDAIPGQRLKTLASRLEDSIVSFFTPGILFEEFGLRYIGPVDGHDIKGIEKALNTAFAYNGPALVHVATKKGMGYKPAEDNPGVFHGVGAFDMESGELVPSEKGRTWTKEFGEKLTELAEKDERIVAITAAMTEGTGLKQFSAKFPERFYDTGIAEQHAMTFAAGLAISGIIPYIALYSTFLQRAYDQVIHDIALQNLPVRICIDRAGLVGADGATHHGSFDLSFLRIVPGLQIMLPRDLKELNRMLELSVKYEGALAIRYARGVAFDCGIETPREEIVRGEPEIIHKGKDFLIISAGHIFCEAYKLWQKLTDKGYSTTLINLRFLNPVNLEPIIKEAAGKKAAITFEENIVTGGVGEMLEIALKRVYPNLQIHIAALPADFVTHGSVNTLRDHIHLTAEKVYEKLTQ